MLQLVISRTDQDLDNYREDLELAKINQLRWPLNCKFCGRRGDLNLQEFAEHEDRCR